MTSEELLTLIKDTDRYNFHSHSQFCDGHAPIDVMAAAAADAGFKVWGFTPHSPLCQYSSCNMKAEQMDEYLTEASRLKELYVNDMKILTSLEIDYMNPDFGPHIDYFQKMPLDYRLGSVHFVPNQDGICIDCDGDYKNFASNLHTAFRDDLRYVVEKYFEQVLMMLERGGFEILGHFDKIAGNASDACPDIENNSWYEALIDDVISHAQSAGVLVEINTKAIFDRKRLYPGKRWWGKLLEAGLPIVVNSDAHYPEKVNLGRDETLEALSELRTALDAKNKNRQ